MKPVTIKYCKVWNYLPRAARVAALIKEKTGLETDLVVGGRGEFTVWLDGKRVAQKDTNGFPSDDEVVASVQAAQKA